MFLVQNQKTVKEIKFSELAQFQPKQREAERILFSPQCKYLLYGGAASGGKSYWLRWTALEMVLYYTGKYNLRGVQVGLFSEDYPTLKDRHIGRIKVEFPQWLGHLSDSREDGLVYKLADQYGAGKIMLRNLDDPSKYASTEFAGECVDELTKNPKDTFDDLRFRLRFPGVKDSKFASASNPGGVGHGFSYLLFVNKDKKLYPPELLPEIDRFFYVPALPTDNKFTPEEYLTTLRSLPDKKRKMYLEGSWEVPEGQFFYEFAKHLHVIDKKMRPKSTFLHFLSMDWGIGEKSAFVCHAHALIPMQTKDGEKFNRVITYREWTGNETQPSEWAAKIFEESHIKSFKRGYVDPKMVGRLDDGSTGIAQLFEDTWEDLGDTTFCHLEKANNERVKGWGVVHDWMGIAPDGLPYWMITNECVKTIQTIPQLVYLKNSDDDLDTKSDDHWADALRYGLVMMPFIRANVGAFPRPAAVDAGDDVLPEFMDSIDLKKFERVKIGKKQRDWRYT